MIPEKACRFSWMNLTCLKAAALLGCSSYNNNAGGPGDGMEQGTFLRGSVSLSGRFSGSGVGYFPDGERRISFGVDENLPKSHLDAASARKSAANCCRDNGTRSQGNWLSHEPESSTDQAQRQRSGARRYYRQRWNTGCIDKSRPPAIGDRCRFRCMISTPPAEPSLVMNCHRYCRRTYVRPSPDLMSRLLSAHEQVGLIARTNPDVLASPEVARSLDQELTHLMVRCLAEGEPLKSTAGMHRRNKVVARLEEFLEANPGRAIYLPEICAALGVAERTLRGACEEQIGMGPIRYLTLRRMHNARGALLRSDPSETSVTQIAADQGFWELGHFSVAYRAMFGETPSETLKRPNDCQPRNRSRRDRVLS